MSFDFYYKRWYDGLMTEPFDSQCNRAQDAINNCFSEDIRNWIQVLLNILIEKGYARVILKDGSLLDVSKIAYTCRYTSFFDIFNNSNLIDLSILPVKITELEYSIDDYMKFLNY